MYPDTTHRICPQVESQSKLYMLSRRMNLSYAKLCKTPSAGISNCNEQTNNKQPSPRPKSCHAKSFRCNVMQEIVCLTEERRNAVRCKTRNPCSRREKNPRGTACQCSTRPTALTTSILYSCSSSFSSLRQNSSPCQMSSQ